MLKKTLLGIAVTSSVVLTGCLDDGNNSENNSIDYQIQNPAFDNKTYPLFNPITSELPIPNDLIWDTDAGDGTFKVPDAKPPVTTALNSLSGASTVSPIDIAMNGAVDPATVNGDSFIITRDAEGNPRVIPNPEQTVFLIELDYASGEPITALKSAEPPTIPVAVTALTAATPLNADSDPGLIAAVQTAGATLFDLARNPRYEASVVNLNDGTSLIRINPLKPLDPRKRYVVAITKEVKDTSGHHITASPAYQNLTQVLDEGTENERLGPPGSSKLIPLQTLINRFWEPIAAKYFRLPNQVRTGMGLPALNQEDIAISYSFTTSNDKKVLGYMAEPDTWFHDTLRTAVSTAARTAAMAGGATDYDGIKAVVDNAIASWPDADTQAALGDAYAFCASQGATAGEPAMGCLGSVFSRSFENTGLINTRPKARDVTFYATTDAARLSALMKVVGVDPGEVSVAMGSMEIPYYLGIPTETDGSALNSQFTANQPLAQALNAQFGGIGMNLPQADPSVSNIVNYLFPFPQKTADVKIPVLAIYPTGAELDNGDLPVVIFQHGITTDRSSALATGSLLAKTAGVVVLAIDQPLHGVAAISTASQQELATGLLAGAGIDPSDETVAAVLAGTFNVGVLMQIQAAGCPTNITDPTNAEQIGAATQLVLAGTCGTGAATRLGGALVLENTVANGASTIPGLPGTDFERHFNFTADAAANPTPMNFDHDNAVGTSGSLFANLKNFINSRDLLRQMVNDLQQLRHSIGGIDLNGNGIADLSGSSVYYIGQSLGTIDGIPFVATVNNTATAADNIVAANMRVPGGGIARLYEHSPTFAPRILAALQASAGITQGDASLEAFINTLQASLDSGDAVNFVQDLGDTPTLLSMVIGDTVIPNSAYPAENASGLATPAPLSGTEPLARLTNATTISSGTNNLSGTAIVRYTAGSHGSGVLPTPNDPEAAAVFQEMLSQSAYLIATDGAQVIVNNTAIIEQPSE
ncbi:MAG: hypothetical protein CSA52_00455 [Gammaproteobacteria bacterium]|nr:MAG: hypothetical protein CSB48_12465 [Pseudomonadota bacterium]PIE38951.1 MAG: hypothetical protein CSA52_00455 [Gammaproteobacteria bacterium]